MIELHHRTIRLIRVSSKVFQHATDEHLHVLILRHSVLEQSALHRY